eukprot:2298722-Rhodomonas_salina.3
MLSSFCRHAGCLLSESRNAQGEPSFQAAPTSISTNAKPPRKNDEIPSSLTPLQTPGRWVAAKGAPPSCRHCGERRRPLPRGGSRGLCSLPNPLPAAGPSWQPAAPESAILRAKSGRYHGKWAVR